MNRPRPIGSFAPVRDQVAEEVLDAWTQHSRQGTEACAEHLAEALGALALCDAQVRGLGLIDRLLDRMRGLLPASRASAAATLGALGFAAGRDPRAVEALTAALHDRSEAVVCAAVRSLGLLGPAAWEDDAALAGLLACLTHRSQDVRRASASALAAASDEDGSPEARRRVEEAVSRDPVVARAIESARLARRAEAERRAAEAVPAVDQPGVAPGVQVTRLLEAISAPDLAVRRRAAERLAVYFRSGVRVHGSVKRPGIRQRPGCSGGSGASR